MSPYFSDYPCYAWQMLSGTRSDGERAMAEMREHDLAPYINLSRPLRILDVANGRLRPQYTILKAAGHHVYGVDYINRPGRSTTDLAYVVARRLYNWRLGVRSEPRRCRTLVCGDVGRLPFPDGFFDLAVSAAAFEHFLDVPAVVADLHRVLRPGGMVWISIHLFASLSGGHNLSFAEYPLRHLPPGVEAWDHLRKRRLPFTVPLNEWRCDQYVEAFARHFEILKHYCWSCEGEEFLTPELLAELVGYDREELTSAAYAIVARKRG